MCLFRRYTTANAESDYDRESERDSEEGEAEASCATARAARRDSLRLNAEDGPQLPAEPWPDAGLAQVLQQADRLHRGDQHQRREGFQLLLNNKLAVKLASLFSGGDLSFQLDGREGGNCKWEQGPGPGPQPARLQRPRSRDRAGGQNCWGCSSHQCPVALCLEHRVSSCHHFA